MPQAFFKSDYFKQDSGKVNFNVKYTDFLKNVLTQSIIRPQRERLLLPHQARCMADDTEDSCHQGPGHFASHAGGVFAFRAPVPSFLGLSV